MTRSESDEGEVIGSTADHIARRNEALAESLRSSLPIATVEVLKREASPLKRDGYPLIDDPEHPLWDEQQAGWPGMPSWVAWSEAVTLAPSRHADSISHPAYDPGYIRNPHATRPDDDSAAESAAGKPRTQRERR